MQANDFPKPYTIQWVINDCCSHSPRSSVSHKVVKSVSLQRRVSEIHLNPGRGNRADRADSWVACGDPLAERVPSRIPHPLWTRGTFWDLPHPGHFRSLVPCSDSGKALSGLCSSCAPCPWVMGSDFLTTLHLALKFPGFWAVCGDRLQFDSVARHGSQPTAQLCWWGGSRRREGFGKFIVVHTQNLCSPQTHAMGREVPWNQRPQAGWHFLPSVPAKLKQFFSTKGRNPTHWDLVV